MLPAGLCFGLNITLFFTAIGRTSIAHAEFITALSPLLLVPLGAVLFHERPDRRALPWGLRVARRPGDRAVPRRQPGRRHRSAATSSWSSSSATWVGYLLTGRRARATVDVVDFMATMMPIGVLTAAPVALVLAGDDIWPLSAQGLDRRRACSSVLTGMIGHGLIAFAQREVDVGTIGIIQVAQPALAVCWSFLILGEAIRPAQMPGHGPRDRRPRRLHDRQPATRGQRRAATVDADQHGELAGPAG